jgi:hypothetical protein
MSFQPFALFRHSSFTVNPNPANIKLFVLTPLSLSLSLFACYDETILDPPPFFFTFLLSSDGGSLYA